jgi:hypothetical protein
LPPTITTSFTFNGQALDTLPYSGGPVVVKVVFANGFLYLNGIAYENSPATFNFTITETKTYDFKVVGAGGEISIPFTVPVLIPNETELLLISGIWIVTKTQGSFYTPNGPWTSFYDYIGSKITFYLSPKKMKSESILLPGTTLWYDWSLNGSLLTGFGDRNIISINSNEMVLIYESSSTQPDGTQIPWFVRETYAKIIP